MRLSEYCACAFDEDVMDGALTENRLISNKTTWQILNFHGGMKL